MKILSKAFRKVTQYVNKIDQLDEAIIEKVVGSAAEKALSAAVLGADQVEFSFQAIVGVHMYYSNHEALRQLPKVVAFAPRNLKEIKDMIQLVGPKQLRLFAMAQLSLGISVSAMVSTTWEKETLLKNWDHIIAEVT